MGGLVWLALLCVASAEPQAPSGRTKLAVLPMSVNRLSPEVGKAIDQLLVGALDDLAKHDVITAADISAMLGLERMKDVVGCTDVSCAAEIGGALGVDHLLVGAASLLGDEVLVSLTLIDSRRSRVIGRKQTSFVNDERRYGAAVRKVVFALFGSDAPAERQSEKEWLDKQKEAAVVAVKRQETFDNNRTAMMWTAGGLGIGGVFFGGIGLLCVAIAPSQGSIDESYKKYLAATDASSASSLYRDVSRNISRRNSLASIGLGLGIAGATMALAGVIVYLVIPDAKTFTAAVEPTQGGAVWTVHGHF